ncbi:hypothetical protein BH09VER1_BH09VER1_44640 [soil metagenome]
MRPHLTFRHQSRPPRISQDIVVFLRGALVIPQTVIEKTALPFHARQPRGCPLEILYRFGQGNLGSHRNQRMAMIRHQQKQPAPPASSVIVAPYRLKNDFGNLRLAKLINSSRLDTQSKKETSPKPCRRMNRMIQRFTLRKNTILHLSKAKNFTQDSQIEIWSLGPP